MAAATIRTVFAQTTAGGLRTQLDTASPTCSIVSFRRPGRCCWKAQGGPDHLRGLPSPVPEEDPVHEALERLNREIKSRTAVVQVFPNPPAVLRLATAALADLHDERSPSPAATSPTRSWTSSIPDDAIVLPSTSNTSNDCSPAPRQGT
ncbi:transposase [Streptomyces olivaceus]|uniref:transposase n=1 Tax=Streptomyces olivaceus TaxID=47716 RepID=UPI003F4C3CFB